MLYKTIFSFIEWFYSRRPKLYQYDDITNEKFQELVMASWSLNPLLYYVEQYWSHFLQIALKISLYKNNKGPYNVDNYANRAIIRHNKKVLYVNDIDLFKDTSNIWKYHIQFNYPPDIMFIFLNRNLEKYVNFTLERGRHNQFLSKEEEKYYRLLMEL